MSNDQSEKTFNKPVQLVEIPLHFHSFDVAGDLILIRILS